MMADTGDTNGWKAMSLRWLNKHAPHYMTSGNKTAHHALEQALHRMSYLSAERQVLQSEQSIEAELRSWDQSAHERMVKFLESGGFARRMEELQELLSKAKGVEVEERARRRKLKKEQSLEEAVEAELVNIVNPHFRSW